MSGEVLFVPPEEVWINYPAVASHSTEITLFGDIVNHYAGTLTYPDRMTVAHETTHMINADLRNKNGNGLDPVGFYVGYNMAVVFLQPKISKTVIADFVPTSLQGDRFHTYVTGMTEWNDSPLYLYDEWTAYTTGGAVCVEQVINKNYDSSWTDGVMGLTEFSVYALATVLAIEKYDPSYLDNTPAYLTYTDFALRRAYNVFKLGSIMSEFKWDKQDTYVNNLRTSNDADSIRDVLTRRFNKVWMV